MDAGLLKAVGQVLRIGRLGVSIFFLSFSTGDRDTIFPTVKAKLRHQPQRADRRCPAGVANVGDA
jgi:hypothetical protein